MAGGVGSRFWPFSTNERPKQFLDFFGTGRSLLRMTYERLDGIVPASNVFVVTNKIYKDTILEQLPELEENQVLLEPMRRNTAPCIAYAVYRIRKQNPKANIVVLPSDHLITNEKEFQRVITEGLRFVANNDALLTLGMKPTRPETGYGYIQFGNGGEDLRKVKTFTEKPDKELAKIFLATGEFLWNAGMFLWKAETFRKEMERHMPQVTGYFKGWEHVLGTSVEPEFITKAFSDCMNISLAYGVMEKTERAWIYPVGFDWEDVGTWESLYNYMAAIRVRNGNAVSAEKTLTEDTKDTLIISPEKKKLVAINGLEDFIVVDTDDVLLICPKDDKKFKDFISQIAMPEFEKYR